MSTPVQGGPAGPLGYAPRRAREAGSAGASPLQDSQDAPPRVVTAPRDDADPLSSPEASASPDTGSLRDARAGHDEPASRDPLPSLREALSSRSPRETPEGAGSREHPQIRDALSALDRLTSRSAQVMRGRPSALENTTLRETLAFRDDPLSREAIFPSMRPEPPKPVVGGGPRDLLDNAVDLDLGYPVRSRTGESTRKRRRRAGDMFEGDAALRELRSRLAGAPDHDPEPPYEMPKTPILGSAMRLMGVVGLAAGGALGFLWITSPHGWHASATQNDEVALVSLGGAESAKTTQNLAVDPAPAADQKPWSMANYTSDAADKAVAPPAVATPPAGVPPVRTVSPPPRSPVTRAAPAPAPPPVESVAPPAPAPAAVVPAPVVTPAPSVSTALAVPAPVPAPAPAPFAITVPARPPVPVAPAPVAAVAPAGRDEISAMLVRARNFLSNGDVAAARVILRRAAERDDAQAAFALASTYDPTVLKKLGIVGFHHPDTSLAREWYRKAAALGSADASLRLDQMVQTDR